MNTYNIVIKDPTGVQQQFGVSASTWANAIIAAKKQVGLNSDNPQTDEMLIIVQLTGKINVTGE